MASNSENVLMGLAAPITFRGDELKERTIDALRSALESAGVELINGDQPGVRLTKAAAARHAPKSASKQLVGTTAVRGKTTKRIEKKP
jgi:hypothetical protein